MGSVLIAIVSFFLYFVAYRTYGYFLGHKIFELSIDKKTPAHTLRDEVDFLPTKKGVLFGHHYASIAGTGPIVGPAIAIIWGWLPALLWVIIGSIFMGAVHDFGSLVISQRNDGKSIGDICSKLIHPRVKILFLLIIFFELWIVVAIFALVIGLIFKLYPSSVIPIWTQIPIAMWLGYVVYRKNKDPFLYSIFAVLLMYITIVIGAYFPISLPDFFGIQSIVWWVIILLIYCFIASCLPVWRLLQPRDYINSHQLIVAMFLLLIGVLVAHPSVSAPVVNFKPEGAPPMIPFIFVIIACGAISGFHSLVSSGTSSKQINKETDALFIGFGAMILEGVLAVLVIIAVAAGIGDRSVWNQYYANWSATEGLGANLKAFVDGSTNMISQLGISAKICATVMGVFIASFAGTTLDTAARIMRYVVGELGESFNVKIVNDRYIGSAIVIVCAGLLAFSGEGGGKGAMILWPLFGTVNQLLAGLALLIITIYLIKKGKPSFYAWIPMVFMVIMTGWAMVYNVKNFIISKNWLLVVIGVIILLLEIWMIIESIIAVKENKPTDIQ